MKVLSITRLLTLSLLAFMSAFVMAETSDRRFEKYNASDGLADNSAQTIYCTKEGRMVITTMGQINFFDGQKFSYIDPTEENLYPLVDYAGNYHLYFDRYHHMWLKNTHNVTCVDLQTEKFTVSIKEEFAKFGMDKQVRDMFVDADGIVWLSVEDGLYSVESKRSYPLRKGHNLQDVETSQDKYLLLFYEDGQMDMVDLTTGKRILLSAAYNNTEKETYKSSSVLLKDHNLFYQIRNGKKQAIFQSFDVVKREWRTIFKTPYHLNNIAKKDSLFYLSSEYGYWIYDASNGHLNHVENLLLQNGQLLNTDINVLAFDKQGGLWVGTENRGLLYARPFNPPFTIYDWNDKQAMVYYGYMSQYARSSTTFRGRTVNCTYRDSRGWTWVGTSQGLHLYRHTSDHLPQIITKNDGLLNNVVHAIVEDHEKRIWVTTTYGVSCVLIKDREIDYVCSYNEHDCVPNEAFVNGGAACLPDGRIVMQSLDHMMVFNPQSMETLKGEYAYEIYPKLIQLLVNGNNVETGVEHDGKIILEKALSCTSEIDLNYNQNSLMLIYSALNYFRPQHTYYRVRVKGLDDRWHIYTSYDSEGKVDKNGRLRLLLESLRPGLYVVEIQSSMLPNQWNTKPDEWIVRIHQPWWRTTGMFVLLGSLLLVLLGINAYCYLRNANMRVMRNSEEQGIINRIRIFAERCCNRGSELLEPTPEEVYGYGTNPQNELSPEFNSTMIKIMPQILSKEVSQISMRDLSNAAGMDVQEFYQLITANIYKSPRGLAVQVMLQRAIEMLETTGKDIPDISDECGFVSVNFFIATFFHHMKQTPDQFRHKKGIG